MEPRLNRAATCVYSPRVIGVFSYAHTRTS